MAVLPIYLQYYSAVRIEQLLLKLHSMYSAANRWHYHTAVKYNLCLLCGFKTHPFPWICCINNYSI